MYIDDTVKIVVGTSVGAITVFLITATTVIVIMLLWYRHHKSGEDKSGQEKL